MSRDQYGRELPPAIRPFTQQPFAHDALCAQTDPDLFTPDGKGSHVTSTARRICAACDVATACLQWAIENDGNPGMDSIYGGLTDRERARLRREQVAA